MPASTSSSRKLSSSRRTWTYPACRPCPCVPPTGGATSRMPRVTPSPVAVSLIERADLLLQQRPVMQRVEDELLALARARVPGDDLCPTGDHHLCDIALHQHRAVAIGGRHRVVVAVVAHQRQCRDPGRFAVAGLTGGRWPRLQGGKIAHQSLADAFLMAANPVIQPLQAALFEMRIEDLEAGHDRHSHQEVAPGIADQPPTLPLPLPLPLPGRPKRSRNR